MTDGSALLMSMMYGFYSAGIWTDHRESNLLDGAAHFYGCYECKDGKYVSVGSIEPQFYEELVKRLELDREKFKDQMDRSRWSELKKIMEKKFMERTRDEWCKVMEGGDICFAPVLSLEESINYNTIKKEKLSLILMVLFNLLLRLDSLIPLEKFNIHRLKKVNIQGKL